MNSLPQELIDYILDYLFDDKISLLSCATVCKSWLPACSFHLFATFTVRLRYPMKDEPQTSSLTEFDSVIDLISKTSRINSHIEHLVVACYDYATPAHPFDEVVLGRLIGPLIRLKRLTLHGVNLYCTRPLCAFQPQRALCSLCIEESRLSSDALRAMFARFTQVDQVQFIRILSIDSPYATPTPTPGPAAVSLPITLQTTSVRALTYSSCPRAQLSALVTPLLASIKVDGELSLEFTNLLLDDLHAVDEHLAAFGPRVTQFSVELPDRWYSWDPPEGNIERLEQNVRLPSMSRLLGLRSLRLFTPIKMSPTAVHINRLMWMRTMDIILSLPGSMISPSVFTSATSSRPPSSQYETKAGEYPRCKLSHLHITCGHPRWFAHAEVPYVLGVVRALDWKRLDEVIAHTGISEPLSNSRLQPSTKSHRSRAAGDLNAIPGERSEQGPEKPLRFQLGCRPDRRVEVENALVQRLSPRVRDLLEFVKN